MARYLMCRVTLSGQIVARQSPEVQRVGYQLLVDIRVFQASRQVNSLPQLAHTSTAWISIRSGCSTGSNLDPL